MRERRGVYGGCRGALGVERCFDQTSKEVSPHISSHSGPSLCEGTANVGNGIFSSLSYIFNNNKVSPHFFNFSSSSFSCFTNP